MKIPPQQQLFNAIFSICLDLNYATFDYLPPSSQSLPFVFIGEQSDQDRFTKVSVFGDVQQTIHIYHDRKKRGELTRMMFNIKTELRKLKKTNDFNFNLKGLNAQTMHDNTDSIPLLHGIIETEYTFN